MRMVIMLLPALLLAGAAFAGDRDYRHDDWSGGRHHEGGGVHGAPGPIAGAGIPVLLAMGGLWVWRRYRRGPSQGNQSNSRNT
jgi:hypothetical protein